MLGTVCFNAFERTGKIIFTITTILFENNPHLQIFMNCYKKK